MLRAFCWPTYSWVVSFAPFTIHMSLVRVYPPVFRVFFTYELYHPTPPSIIKTQSVCHPVVPAQSVRALRYLSCLLH